MPLTEELIEICISFIETSLTDDKFARFNELVNDERVDVKAMKQERRQEISPLNMLLSRQTIQT